MSHEVIKKEGEGFPRIDETYGLRGIHFGDNLDMKFETISVGLQVVDPNFSDERKFGDMSKYIQLHLPCELLGDMAANLLKFKNEYEQNKRH
jgi:hypothetical protein